MPSRIMGLDLYVDEYDASLIEIEAGLTHVILSTCICCIRIC